MEEELITLITCSGVSNTGRLTTQVALTLRHRFPEIIETHLPASIPMEELERAIAQAERICVLDGCEDCCGSKKLGRAGGTAHIHIVATSCGVAKNGLADPNFEEIERIAGAVRESILNSRR
jgi:uncharacterized metal-binding protein